MSKRCGIAGACLLFLLTAAGTSAAASLASDPLAIDSLPADSPIGETLASVPPATDPVEPEPELASEAGADPVSRSGTLVLENAIARKADPDWGRLSRADEPVGTYRLAAPDLARSVSSLGDPSRIVQTLPGVGRPSDWETALIVRGGAPDQTGYLLDGVPVSRVSHFEGMDNEHGGLGMLSLEYVEGIDFHNGAFAAHLPDRMSGVVEVRYRDGDTASSQSRIITDVTGAGAAVEGPLTLDGGRRGSFAGLFRYSTMDLLIRSGMLEAFGTPRYFNGQVRAYLPSGNSALRLNVTGGGEQWFNGIGHSAVLNVRGSSLNAGASWERKEASGWTRVDGYFQARSQAMDFHNTTRSTSPGTDSLAQKQIGTENRFGISADKAISVGDSWTVRLGGTGSTIEGIYRLENLHEQTFIPEADTIVSISQHLRNPTRSMAEGAGYLEATWRTDAWEWYAGYRHFFEQSSGQHGLGPRLGFKYRPSGRQAFKAGLGLHTQPHDYVDISMRLDPSRAKLPYTVQAATGWECYLPAGNLFSIEAYAKEGYRLARKSFILRDGGIQSINTDTGRARSRGGEVYLRKPRGGFISYSATYGYLWHRELNYTRAWSKSEYSIPHSFNAALEVALTKRLFLGGRFSAASGMPYIPFDSAASMRAGTGVYDIAKAYTVSESPFYRVDVRLEWEGLLRKLGVSVFAEVENLLDRRNAFSRRWNTLEGGDIALQGMGRIPVVGLAVRF